MKPGEYGVPKPFYFPCLPSYWSGAPRRSEIVEVRYSTTSSIGHNIIYNIPRVLMIRIMLQPKSTLTEDKNTLSNHEEVGSDLNVGISIRNLTKIYGQVITICILSCNT